MVEVASTASVAAAEPAESATVLFESERTRVSRIPSSGGGPSWVLKQPLGPRAGERMAHERRILQRLSAVQGVARLAETQRFDGLVLQDDAGETLAAALAAGGAFDVDAWLALALGLTRAVGGLHRAGVMHKDINPANILIVGGGAPVLIDFDLATTSAEERPRFVHHRQIVGTFPYMAPEQTGRTGGTVDERADLYALGRRCTRRRAATSVRLAEPAPGPA